MIFIPRRVKAGLYTYLKINYNKKESPRETRHCYSRCENAIYAVQSKSDSIIFIPRRVKARLYIFHN
jgi:UPF0288 family protein (methanogenesis marker protein 3)